MNKYIASYVQSEYGIDINNCSNEDLLKVTNIDCEDVTSANLFGKRERCDWDFSLFPNLRRINCRYNHIDSFNVTQNLLLEEINWQGVRGRLKHPIDISNNHHLKKVYAGQDELAELDLSENKELEELYMIISSSMRWINLDHCENLKVIRLAGVNIPFVDLTNCPKIELCDIHYMNLYINQRGEFGPGYPRPIIFVREDFDENVIPYATRREPNFRYLLIRVSPNSVEQSFLESLKSRKEEFTSIWADNRGTGVALKHYKLLEELDSLRNNK